MGLTSLHLRGSPLRMTIVPTLQVETRAPTGERVESEAFMSHVPSEEKVSDGGGNRLKWQRCDGGMAWQQLGRKLL